MENNSWKFIAACCDAGLRKRKEEEEEKTDQHADRTWVKWKTRVGTGSTSISTARRIPSLEKEEEEDGRFSYIPVWEQKFVGRPPIIMVDANYLQPLFFPSLLLVDKFMKSRFEGKISLTLTRIWKVIWIIQVEPGSIYAFFLTQFAVAFSIRRKKMTWLTLIPRGTGSPRNSRRISSLLAAFQGCASMKRKERKNVCPSMCPFWSINFSTTSIYIIFRETRGICKISIVFFSYANSLNIWNTKNIFLNEYLPRLNTKRIDFSFVRPNI